MADRRVVKMGVGYLQSMFENMRLLNRLDEAKCLELFGITKAQALENMVAGLERTVEQKLAEKTRKKAVASAYPLTMPEIEPSVDDLIGGNS